MRRVLIGSVAGVLAYCAHAAFAAPAVGPAPSSAPAAPAISTGSMAPAQSAPAAMPAAPPAAAPAAAPATTAKPIAVPKEERAARPSSVPLPTQGAQASSPPGMSAQPSGPAETLQQALVDAYRSNPNLLAARAQLRALDESLPQASAGWKPTVQLTGSYGYTDSHTSFQPAAPGFGTTIIKSHPLSETAQVTQPIFKGGRTFFGVKEAQHNVEAGRARLASTEQQTFINVVTAYFNVIRDRATVDLNKNNVNVLQRQLDAAHDRFEVGEITRTDVAQAEARLKQAESQLIASQAQLVASQDAYKTVVGRPPGNLEVAPALPPLPRSEEDAQTEAVRNNPTLLAAHETEKASNAAVKVAVGALLPSVSITGQYNHSEGQKTSFGPTATFGILSNSNSVTGQVTIPIYQAGTEYASIRQAKHTASQNRLLSDQALRDAEESVANAWEQLRAAGAAITSNKEQVNANQIAYEGVVQEAQVGSRTTLDVLNAEQELLNSQVALVQSQRDQYVAAYALLSSMGALTAQKLGLPVQIYDPKANTRSLLWKQIWPGAGEGSD